MYQNILFSILVVLLVHKNITALTISNSNFGIKTNKHHRNSSLFLSQQTPLASINGFLFRNQRDLTLFAYKNDKNESNESKLDLGSKDELINPSSSISNSYYILSLLLITFISNQWCRQSIYYLCDFSQNSNAFKHINVDLIFSKEQYGVLASLGFTLVFAIVSLFSGGVADKYNRKIIIAIACSIWSIATILHGSSAQSFSDLIPLRAIIGASQAFFGPAAFTLVADLFPKNMVGSVNGVLSSGIYLGGGLASLSIILDGQLGWRKTMMFTGGVGLLAALLSYLTIPEPRKSKSSQPIINNMESTSSIDRTDPADIEQISFFTKSKLAIFNTINGLQSVCETTEAKLLLSASTLRFCAGFSIGIWKAPFIFAKFPGSDSLFAGSNAVVVAGGGLLSSLLGGYISDYLSNPKAGENRIARSRSWVPAIGSLLAVPLWAGFVLSDSPEISALCLLGEYLAAECWYGPTLAALFNVVPNEKRGVAQGLFSVLTAAGNIAPIMIGSLFSGSLTGTSYALSDILLYVVSSAYFISGIFFTISAVKEDERLRGLKSI
eukprot:gene8728-11793_t